MASWNPLAMVPAPLYGRVPNALSESAGNLITSCDNGLPRRTKNFSFHSNRHLQIHLVCRLEHQAIVCRNYVAHLSKNVLFKIFWLFSMCFYLLPNKVSTFSKCSVRSIINLYNILRFDQPIISLVYQLSIWNNTHYVYIYILGTYDIIVDIVIINNTIRKIN